VARPKSGWFFGFKLHLAVNDQGELLACCLTPGNVDDRRPVPFLVKRLRGKLIGDRGYISAPLTQLLFEQGLHLITRLRKNMSNRLMHLSDKLLVRKRAIIETIIDQLKNISETRAFSPSQSHQFCSSSACWSLCVLPPAQKAFLTS
jgi:Transposase DDE domain